MAEYQTNMQEFGGAIFTDAEKAIRILLDSADEQTNLGGFEPIERGLIFQVAPFLVRGLVGIQEKARAVEWTAEDS